MHLLDQTIVGIVILGLLGLLVTVKQAATGSILDKPRGNLLIQVVNIFNLFFLLIVNPLAAILLIAHRLPADDPTHFTINDSGLLMALEILGAVLYIAGYFLMASALICLGHNYQLGGTTPRSGDKMVMAGPYRLIRHPMYSAALSISVGLACLIQSWAFFGVFLIYLGLILTLVPVEENALGKVYGEQYGDYRMKTRKLIPFVY